MDRDYTALPMLALDAGAGIRRPTQARSARITLESPALEAMTDLSQVSAATIRPQAPVEGANQYMISRGVRLLLVVDDREFLAGLITATDILGEKAVLVATERGLRRDELAVADIMTPMGQIEAIALSEAQSARVGHVVQTLKRAGRQHALVVEFEDLPSGNRLDPPVHRPMVRGIFSVSQIARQLGIAMQTSEIAVTFSEIEAALGH